MKCCPPGKLIRDSVPGVFMVGAGPTGLAHTKEAGLPEGRLMFNRNHIVYQQLRHSAHQAYLFRGWWETAPKPSFQTPARGQPCQQVFLRIAASEPQAAVTPFFFFFCIACLAHSRCSINFSVYCHSTTYSGLSQQQGEAILSPLPSSKPKGVPTREMVNRKW